MTEQPKCELCGEPMPPGEEMFKFHGYSGPCPKPPKKNPMNLKELQAMMAKAANRLHHLSMRYAGAICEVATGKKLGMLAQGHPGLREFRDLADLILLTRAEINAMTELCVKKGVFTVEEFTACATENYDHMTEVKCRQLNVTVTDDALVYNLGPDRN